MKNSTFKAISFLINLLAVCAVFYFSLPFWSLLLLIPAGVYLQILAAQQFTFRDSIRLEEIPAKGYEKRIVDLNTEQARLISLGFLKFDEFYLQTSSDIVIYAYKHQELPVILCHYHLEAEVYYDLMTDFENDFALTTANLKYSAVAELRPARELLQSFYELPVEALFYKHVESLRFLESRGFITQNKPLYEFKQEFLSSFQRSANRMKGFLTPVKIFYLMYFGNKARFSKSIQEQFLADQLRLP